ncbi:transporter [Paracidovorax avenae]
MLTLSDHFPALRRCTREAALAAAVWLLAGYAYAVDLDSQDLIPAPAGTNAVLGYLTYTDRDSFWSSGGSALREGTGLKSTVGIFRYVRYMDLGGFAFAPQVLLPYGRLYDGSLGGAPLESASGAGDPIFAAPVWLVNQPGTTFAVVPYLFVPAGSYRAGRTLNLGENRWKANLQVGGTHQLGAGFGSQLSADVMWYGTNDEAGAGSSRLRQQNSYQVQAWLTYTPPSDASWTFSTGYSGLRGGRQRLDGLDTGQATRADQLRLEVSKFITPTLQIQGLVQRDIKVRAGFKEDVRATLRVLKVF